MAISLASLRTSSVLQPPRILIHGVAGVGKSTFAADAGAPVFIMTEDGLGKLQVPHFPLATSYAEVAESLDALLEEDHDYGTVVVDSVDWLEPLIWAEACKRNGWQSIETPGFGKGFAEALTIWREYLDKLNALRDRKGMVVIQIAHTDIKRFDSPEHEPYLSPLVSKQPATRLDVSNVGTRAGDYIQRDLAAAVDKDAITRAAVTEIIEHGRNRKSWLAFCSGVEHARHVAEEFTRQGITCRTIFGDTPKDERDAIVAAFKRGEIRALASMGVLTTGFNAPAVDLIALLRPTKSAGLYVQMVGRGTRLAPGKENCLVLDFAGNVRRHGPIDLVRPKRPGEGGGGEAPTKVCPMCESIIALSSTECPDCGYEFPAREVKIAPTAAALPVLSPKAPQWLPVHGVSYSRHDKLGGQPSLKVSYSSGLKSYSEWVCIEHQGYATKSQGCWLKNLTCLCWGSPMRIWMPCCALPMRLARTVPLRARMTDPNHPSHRYQRRAICGSWDHTG
jgi:hypothetical protein